MSIASKLQTVAENEQRVYNAGYTVGEDDWEKTATNNYQRYNYLFFGCRQVPGICLRHSTSAGTDFSSTFDGCALITSVPPVLDTSNGTNFRYMFNGCAKLTSIPTINTSNGTDFTGMFAACSKLTSIPLIDISKATMFDYMFRTCTSLTTINFTGSIKITNLNLQYSPLTIESLRNLINALEPKTSGTFKVTVGATNLAKLTSDDLDLISEKGWTFV